MNWRNLSARLFPWLIALLFASWALRGVRGNSVVDTDAARHAMNGAFILDLVRHGQLFSPVHYAHWYYARYPAISIPYHPPGFPLVEAIFFALGGVNILSARLAVAVAVGMAAVLLYRLVKATHGSAALALCSVIAFLSLPVSQLVGSDVMLEFPALVPVIAAVHSLRLMMTTGRWRHSLAFTAFGGAAIWTKQTVFLILLPFLYIVMLRRWQLLRSAQVWVAAALLCLAALGLAALGWSVGWSGISAAWQPHDLVEQLQTNLWFYLHSMLRPTVAVPGVALLLAWAWLRLRPRAAGMRDEGPNPDLLYLAWLAAVLPVLVISPAFSARYLFFAYPAAVVLGLSIIVQVAAQFTPRWRYVPAMLVTGLVAAFGLSRTPASLSGPADAAAYVFGNGAKRVLYCGLTDGNFIFSLRALDKDLSASVIRGEKIPEDQARPDALPDFARRFGVDYLILEQSGKRQLWDGPIESSHISLERVIPQSSSQTRLNGRLSIYRVYGASHDPSRELDVPISVFGRTLKEEF
jgi:4-amino-4-deoxy-L-arabinose transferase-like glycosyltransferase